VVVVVVVEAGGGILKLQCRYFYTGSNHLSIPPGFSKMAQQSKNGSYRNAIGENHRKLNDFFLV
jgi:hypothetical protein